MKRTCSVLSVLALLGACMSLPKAVPEPHPDDGALVWKPLFASDLGDAVCFPGAWAYNAEGSLEAKASTPIWTKGEHANYALDLEYRLRGGGTGGVFIHLSGVGDLPLVQEPQDMVEVQLLDDRGGVPPEELPDRQLGVLSGRVPARAVLSKPAGEWNRLTVYCRGRSVRVVQNGFLIVEGRLDDGMEPLYSPTGSPVPPGHRTYTPMSTVSLRGRIGFRGGRADGSARMELRNVRIATID